MDNTIKGYIYHQTSYESSYYDPVNDKTETVNYVDIFYVNINDKLKTITNDIERNKYIVNNCLSCLRLYNFYVSFYIVKLPGMSGQEFKDFILNNTKHIKDIVIRFKTTFRGKPLIESSYFNFNKQTLYAKIKAKSSSKLKYCYNILKKAIKAHYDNIANDEITLTNWDEIFYNNTETPFRNDMTTLTSTNIKYYLSTKYNIPCVGGIVFSYDDNQVKTLSQFPINEFPGYKFMSFINKDINKEYKTLFINMQGHNKIFHQIKHDENITGQEYLTLMSYDIETYESNMKKLDEAEKVIMCIGVGVFNITNDKPFIRYCLSIKDFSDEDIKLLGSRYVVSEKETTKNYTVKYVYNEYTKLAASIEQSEYTEATTNIKQPLEFTKYIICNSEQTMFKVFIKLINEHRPTFLTGFNNYGFDDRRIYDRMAYYNLNQYINNILQYYDFSYMNGKNVHIPKQFMVNQSKFSIKIDGEMYNDNITWMGETKTFIVDVYKIMLASNAKLYTQQGRGNLDTMLLVNGINNPFNGKPLSKSGLSYNQMWFNWDNNKNIYDIMLYCCQDAWITGTLLIKSCQLIDKIEMSTLSATTISDSIYKAVTWRVKHIIERYAWENNFAVADSINNIVDKDGKHISRADNHQLGNKHFDVRQIVGGEVKNVISGKTNYIIALDFSAMYPSQKEGSNIDTSATVPDDVINNPTKYGLTKYHPDIEINDMYKQRNVIYLERTNTDGCKPLDRTKYIIEKFQSVFKNDLNEINKTLEAMEADKLNKSRNKQQLVNILKKLQPNTYEELTDMVYEHDTQTKNIMQRIQPTETRYLYTVQSPRNENNVVITHYSLKEIMLSDLRALRSKVKHQMETATNAIDKSRYNSKQLAIKVMCNSEYGASNSSYFPYYDPLIGGATTAASRCLINFLTNIIQTSKLYVNERFMKTNKEYIEHLHKYGVIEWKTIDITDPTDFVKNNRRFALRQLFDEYYNVVEPVIYELTIKPSMVVYQDTDSNYYTNEYIKALFSPNDTDRRTHLKTYFEFIRDNYGYSLQFNEFEPYYNWVVERGTDYEDPTMINLKMNLLLSHNNLVGNFIKDAICRKPISVGFEGAFTIARYFNVKKKYYGHVWNDKMTFTLPKEYYKDGILQDNYKNGIACNCFPLSSNGDYIHIDEQKLLSTETDKLAYIKKQNIKLTGVDLARRDQYKFININHIRLIQHDLHYLKYIGDNKWVNISNVNIHDIVISLLQAFKQQFVNIDDVITSMNKNEEHEYNTTSFYTLNDYTKDVSFKYTKANFLVCTTRIYINTDKKEQYERYLINDLKERLPNGLYKSECKAYTTTSGSLMLTLSRNENGDYVNVYSTEYTHINANIPAGYKSLFYLSKVNTENTNKDEFYIDYDCVNWEKQSKIMTTIGNRMYEVLESIKDNTQSRLTNKTFTENFPAGFSRKQYVIFLTEATKRDRLKGTKTESVKNSDKAYLIKELHKKYKQKLTIEEYNKLTYHESILYKRFIDLMIINDLDHVHYMEAFANAMSLYLIEYAKEILTTKDYNAIKHLITNDVIEDENNNKSVADIKKLIAWQLLITVYPDRIRKKPTIKKFSRISEQLYKDDLTHEEYKRILLTTDPNIINEFNKRLNNGGKKIFTINDQQLETLKRYEEEYNNNKIYKQIVNSCYKRYCNTDYDIPWRLVVERSTLLLTACMNTYRTYERKLTSITNLEEYYDKNITPNIEIFKTLTCSMDKTYFDRLYGNTQMKTEHKNKIRSELKRIQTKLVLLENLITLLNNVIATLKTF